MNQNCYILFIKLIFIGLFLSLPFFLSAQKSFHLDLNWEKELPNPLLESLEIKEDYPDSLSVINAMKSLLLQLHGQAYLEASIDSLKQVDSIFTAEVYLGNTYEWAELKNGNVAEVFLSQVGYRERLYQNKPFRYLELRKLQESLLTYVENNGYPFASVWLDSLKIEEERISAQLFMNLGSLVLIEDIKIEGDVKITKAYLQNYLGLKPGSLYSKEKILKVRDRLRELPFLQEKKNVTVTFNENQATINLTLEKRKASRFDFLIGFLPGNNPNNIAPGEAERNLLITGTFNAELENQFGLGERIFVAFERLRPETQELELQFAYPYILQMPFGVDLKFNQYKRDSTYSDVIFDGGFQYLLEGGNYVKAFWNNTASNLLSVDTIRLKNGNPPDNLDVSNTSYGIELSWQRLDYRYNPRKGWNFFFKGGAGFKKIEENNQILAIQENFYDTLKTRTFQFRLLGKAERYFPLFQRATLKTAFTGGAIFSEEPIFQNEQFRIGGNRLLRGFDEESIFATLYGIFTMEARLLIGQNSYFYVFGDYAYLEDKTSTRRNFDRPYGMGLGLTFETGAGVFGLSLAVGSQLGNPIDFANPKIHFGYVSFF